MGMSFRTVRWLNQTGHDAVHLSEQDLQKLPDDQILEKARVEDRIVLTLDLDFGYLLAVSGEQLPSVILFRLDNQSSEMVNERLAAVLTQCESELKAGAIVSVNEEAIRVRSLPV